MNKKLLISVLVGLPLMGAAAFVLNENRPIKRFARHLVKARLYAQEGNATAALSEYELAYKSKGGYTPWADFEVLQFTNRMHLSEKKPLEALANTKQFVAANPKVLKGRLTLAELALQVGEMETAFSALDAAMKDYPADFGVRLLLTRLRTAQGRFDLAEEQLRYLVKSQPDSLPALLPLADNLMRQGKSEEARSFAREALLTHPHEAELQQVLVDSYLFEKKLDSAQAALDAWSAAEPKLALPIQVRKARLFSLQGKYPEAKALLAAYLESKEVNLPALNELAQIQVQTGQYDSALKIYATMVEIKPAARQSLERMAIDLHLKNNNPARALESIKLLAVNDRDMSLIPLLVGAYLAMDNTSKLDEYAATKSDSIRKIITAVRGQLLPDKAYIGQWALIHYYQTSHQSWMAFQATRDWQKTWPTNRMATIMFAGALAKVRLFADALKLIEGIPDTSVEHLQTLIKLANSAGQRAKAAAWLAQLEKSHPNLPGIHQLQGDNALAQGDHAAAVSQYEAELALKPGNLAVINNLAWEYGVSLRNLAKAQPYMDQLMTQKLLDPRLYDTMGWILALNGKAAEGKGYLKTALDLVPDHPTFNYHMAVALANLGEKSAAKTKLSLALQSKMAFPERKDAEAMVLAL